jgi:DNA-binding CsgD family transcriptional regulator
MMTYIKHYGTPQKSGRYPWGSGDDPEQRNRSFLGRIKELEAQGKSQVEIAEEVGMSTTKLRARKSIANAEQKKAIAAEAFKLKEKGWSNVAIGKHLGYNESSIRSFLNPTTREKNDITTNTANALKAFVAEKKYVDVGIGVERHMGVARTKLNTAIEKLKDEEGYTMHYPKVEQLGTGKQTSLKVLAAPGVTFSEVYANVENVKTVTTYTEDRGRSWAGLKPIENISSKRVLIRHGEEGGKAKDGVIELRRDVQDLSLDKSRYAQVRIGVDGSHYMKGMAMYSDDIPKGYDAVYNSNKPKGTPKGKVFKPMTDDEGNPFGAVVRQKHYITDEGARVKGADKILNMKLAGKNDKEIAKTMKLPIDTVKKAVKVSALNIVNEEGEWAEWTKTISSQVLSKQAPALAKKQLGLAYDTKSQELDEILELTNPTIKKKLLESFASGADSASVHLKSAALPRQGSHVLLPFPDMRETEIYAPNYNNGERVVLIRYPHGGIFEIPELTVNNKHRGANKVIKNAKDAIGINHKVAEQMSGADFDGDSVLVIPNSGKTIKTSAPLKGLLTFDPQLSYKGYEGMPEIKPATKQKLMGDVSNLITDMSIKRATTTEIAKAVRHSMVVIDSEKHNLNYKASHIDNGISGLKTKYQGGYNKGAATLISRASSQKRIPLRKEGELRINPKTGKPKRFYVDPSTGQKLYEATPETYTNRKGKVVEKRTRTTKLGDTEDAFTLSSGRTIETVYANHSNKLKAIGNRARKIALGTPPLEQSASAKKTFDKEVKSLNAQLNIALKNAPLERQAQIEANRQVAIRKTANPNMEADSLKKIKGQALVEARLKTGAYKHRIDISKKEWTAIQAGAVSNNLLSKILNNTDLDKVKALATPRAQKAVSTQAEAKAKRLAATGHTQAEIASTLGISTAAVASIVG